MRIDDIALKHNISKRVLQKRAKEALEQNKPLNLNGSKYNVLKDTKGYRFKDITPKALEQTLSDIDKKWLKTPKDKRDIATKRAKLVSLWERRAKGVGFDKFIQNLPWEFSSLEISEATFFRWVKRVRVAKEKNIPPSYALLDTRGGDRGTSKISKEIAVFIENSIVKNPDIKATRVHRYICDKFGEVCSYSTVDRFIKKFKANNAFILQVATNPDKAVSKLRPAFGKMDTQVAYANALWELDATPADIITSDGKRYILSAAIDVYSRRVVVVVEESASFSTLGVLFRKAIKTLGIPDAVKTDNGKDYTSNNFNYMCQRLNIEHILVPPFSGYYKPYIERFFRTLSHDLFEDLPGYIGHNVAQREAIVNRQTFEQKLKSIEQWRQKQKDGNTFAKKFALKKENRGMAVEIPLSKDELQEWIDKWIKVYENRLHRGIKTTPLKKWEQSPGVLKHISDARVLDILTGFSETKKVTKKGITFLKKIYSAPELYEFVGESVQILCDDELGKIYVYDKDYNYICTATNEEFMGKSRVEYIRATKRFDKKLRKALKLIEELRSDGDNLMQEHIEAQLAKIDPQADGVGYELKNELTKSVIDALEDNNQEVHKELKDDKAIAVVDGKPVFNSPYDRFVWELKNHCVSDLSKKLKEKYPQSWEAALKAVS